LLFSDLASIADAFHFIDIFASLATPPLLSLFYFRYSRRFSPPLIFAAAII